MQDFTKFCNVFYKILQATAIYYMILQDITIYCNVFHVVQVVLQDIAKYYMKFYKMLKGVQDVASHYNILLDITWYYKISLDIMRYCMISQDSLHVITRYYRYLTTTMENTFIQFKTYLFELLVSYS